MKKFTLVLAAFALISSAAFADRYVELGIDLNVEADQNLMTIPEIFVEELVIDLPKIANGLGSDGMAINAALNPDLYLLFNFNRFGIGFDLNLDLNARVGVSKDLFDIVATGNKVGEPVVGKLSAGLEAYVEAAVPIRIDMGRLNIKATPSMFVPLFYLPNPHATVTVLATESGDYTLSADANFEFYSIVDASACFSGSEFTGFESLLNSFTDPAFYFGMLNCSGFDLDAVVTYDLFRFLEVGGYTHIAIVPGHLNYKLSGGVNYEVKGENILGNALTGGDLTPEMTGPTFSAINGVSGANYSVNRPFRLGATAVLKLSPNFKITPSFGYATRNPFGDGWQFSENSFLEWGLNVDWRLLSIFRLFASTEYTNEVYAHSAGLGIDLRIAEIDVKVGTCSSDFIKSFTGAGLKAMVGVKVGF